MDCKFKVPHVFGGQEVAFTLYKGMTVLIGANGTGKTQTLKQLKYYLAKSNVKVRYLSSNRIGTMEAYRSKCDQYSRDLSSFSLGGREVRDCREKIETATGDFFAMDARRDIYIKVAERLSVLFGRQVLLRWDDGHLKVYLSKTNAQVEYSIVAEASGLVNIISILAALYDDAIKCLLIDEPEVSLHPQLQAYLLQEIEVACRLMDKTVVLSTHSPEMVEIGRPEDICRYVFFEEGKLPCQIQPTDELLKSKKLQEFLLRLGEIYKIGFFAKKVLLIEGVSDLIICKAIANKLSLTIGVAGSQIIPVDGKGQFPIVAKLFRLIGKDVAAMTDLDGFLDDDKVVGVFDVTDAAKKIANERGVAAMTDMVASVKSKMGTLIAESINDYESIVVNHPYYMKEDQDELHADASKLNTVVKRALIAELFAREDCEIKKWPKGEEWCSLRTQLSGVLDALEEVGLYVLRKGAIESYCVFANSKAYEDKPSNAVLEAEGISDMDRSAVEQCYDVIVRALKQVATSRDVDESYAVRKELLSEVGVALETLAHKVNADKGDVINEIKRSKGTVNSLFAYEIVDDAAGRRLKVDIKTKTLQVNGFPFDLQMNDNVNQVVDREILPG